MSLPKVSIITPTYNKPNFLWLAIHNFNSIDYPREKLEWIIVDDSDKSNQELFAQFKDDSRICYYYFDKTQIQDFYAKFIENYNQRKREYKALRPKGKKRVGKYKLRPEHKKRDNFKGGHIPIGMKRNICCRLATGEYIVHMDDDDLYPATSVRMRIDALLENTQFGCVGCSSFGAFHIGKMISIIYQPKNTYTAGKKISPATFAYKKTFWETQKFENQDMVNEGEAFLRKRECLEIHWRDVIIALFHSRNEREISAFKSEANGWHFYTLSDEMFKFITNLEIGEKKFI